MTGMDELRNQIAELRKEIAALVVAHGLELVSAATTVAEWREAAGAEAAERRRAHTRIAGLEKDLAAATMAFDHADAKVAQLHQRLEEALVESANQADDVRMLRFELFSTHECQGTYGDDGEMQCNHAPPIDFKRDPVPEIARKRVLHMYSRMAELQQVMRDSKDVETRLKAMRAKEKP